MRAGGGGGLTDSPKDLHQKALIFTEPDVELKLFFLFNNLMWITFGHL
jgi:hypothetical protein